MKNGKISSVYDIFVNVGKGHEDGLRAYAAHAIGTPQTKVGKALGVANVVIGFAAFTVGMTVLTLKAYDAGEKFGERIEAKVNALKARKAAAAKAAVSDEAKEGLEDYIGRCTNTVSFDAMEAMADRAVKSAESRELTDEEAEELGL